MNGNSGGRKREGEALCEILCYVHASQDSFIEGLAPPPPPETKECTTEISNEQEDQILLEVGVWWACGVMQPTVNMRVTCTLLCGCTVLQRLKEVERRAQELAEARKVKAAKGRTPSVRSGLEGLASSAAPSTNILQQASSPEELLFLLQKAQK